MKQIRQFRYYSSSSANNYPAMANYYGKMVHGNIFSSIGAISHLGIQGIPGTKFYLNNSPHPITIGFTGIYEIEFADSGRIYAIRFDKTTLDALYTTSDENRLLIDIVYEGGSVI